MFAIIGVLVVTGCVLGGYAMAHGPFAILFQPAEVIIIGGASLGGLLIGTPLPVLKIIAGKLPGVFGGSPYNKQAYLSMLSMLYEIFGKARKEGLIALEQEVNNPEQGEIFKKYPRFLKNHRNVDFLCDTLKLMVNGVTDTFEIEKAMDAELETHHQEGALPSGVLARSETDFPALESSLPCWVLSSQCSLSMGQSKKSATT